MELSPEDALSEKVKLWLKRLNDIEAISTVHFHVPNEFVATGNGFAAWQKKEAIGCLAGAPDWVVISEHHHCLMELKDAKTMKGAIGKLSKAQKEFAIVSHDKNINRYTVYDKESFLHALRDSKILKIKALHQCQEEQQQP